MSFIPATILTGFLGSGKTTLLKRVLTESHGQRIAVIENEFGEEDIDTEILVADTRENIVQMSNGCVCCTIRGDLRKTLRELAEKRRKGALQFDRVVIETTGLADPGPVAQTFFMDERVAEAYMLDSILTLVDAVHATGQLNERQEARRQVGFADRIFISKTELVEPVAVEALRHRLTQMNPRAPQRVVHFGNVALSDVFDLRGFNLTSMLDIDPGFLTEANVHSHAHAAGGERCDRPSDGDDARHHHHPADDVKSFVFRSERAFDPTRLERFLGKLVDDHGQRMLRYKGVLHMHGTPRKVIFQGIHQLMSSDEGPKWTVDEIRQSKLVFIGIEMPKNLILYGLEGCLV